MTTLITGGSGLVGRALQGDIKLSSKDGDLRSWDATISLFKHYKPDYIIHCAARVGGVASNMRHKGEFYYDNIMINTNVLEAARQVKAKKVVSFLSTCIFPAEIEYPLTEKKIHVGAPHHSNYGYAYAKRMLDVQTRMYREQYGVNYICVVPTNIYGKGDNFNTENGHVIPSLIHKCYLAKKNNTDFVVWGSGASLREFMFSEDIGKLTAWALDNYNEEEPIIFTTSQEISIKEAVDVVVEYMNFKGKVVFDTTMPDGQFRKPADNSKLMSYIPNFRFVSLKEGLRKTIEWFEETYPNIRK